jgi:multidrug efflux pump subunit AcrA (membrane-fusion protein)
MQQTTPRPNQLRPQATRLLEILEATLAVQREILAGIRARREAVRRADFAELALLEKGESPLALRMQELERARVAELAQLTIRLALPPKSPLADIAARLPEPDRARLDLVRSELRGAIADIQRESGVVRQASERLSAHMAGILQSVHSALAHAKVYSRGGVIAIGPNVISTLDIKS